MSKVDIVMDGAGNWSFLSCGTTYVVVGSGSPEIIILLLEVVRYFLGVSIKLKKLQIFDFGMGHMLQSL